MRPRPFVLASLLAVVLWSPASGHPGHGPGQVVVADKAFTPAKLTVAAGDTVIWFWTGPDTNHSVTSDSDSEESFDSDPETAPPLIQHDENDTFTHVFERVGVYGYHCKVHDTMRGTVEVIEPPRQDLTPPRVTDLRVVPARASRRARARFTLSERSFVVARVRRAGSSKVRMTANAFLRAGERRIRFGVRELRPGRYRATVVAEDNAANPSRPKTARFRVVRD